MRPRSIIAITVLSATVARAEPASVLVGVGADAGTHSSEGAVLAFDTHAPDQPTVYAAARYEQLQDGQHDECSLLSRGWIAEGTVGARFSADEPAAIGGRPFVSFGAGVTRISTSNVCPNAVAHTATGFLLEVPLGIDYWIGRRLVLRVDVRPVFRDYLSQTGGADVELLVDLVIAYRI